MIQKRLEKLENSKVQSQFRDKSPTFTLGKRENVGFPNMWGASHVSLPTGSPTELKFWMTLDQYGFANPQRFFFQQGGYAKNGNYGIN